MNAISEYQSYTPAQLKHALGGIESNDAGSIISAMMILCDLLANTRQRVERLEDLARRHEDDAAADTGL